MSAVGTPVAVVGASGYTGQELVRLLAVHPEFELVGLFGSEKSGEDARAISEVAPALVGLTDLEVGPASVGAVIGSGARVVFLATPHEASIALAARIRASAPEIVIVDLSAGFRLRQPGQYPVWYGFAHSSAALLSESVYGLPEVGRVFERDALAGATLIACAGCYVTAASVALAPVVKAGLVRAGARPIIDAMSGVSGAGRKAAAHTSFCEVSATPYGVQNHRHRPEIAQALGLDAHGLVFQPALGPWHRGILATCHAELADGVGAGDVALAYRAYADEAFVRTLGEVKPGSVVPSVGSVERTNFVDIAWSVEETDAGAHLSVFSALDNLVKGASGQAVQCANAALGLPETLGLLPAGWKAVHA